MASKEIEVIKVLTVGDEHFGLIDAVKKELGESSEKFDFANQNLSFDDRKSVQPLSKFPMALISGEASREVTSFIQRRSLGSHFLSYVDFVVNKSGKLWGHSLFVQVFKNVLLKSIQNQDFKGSVIFLGHSSLALPIVDVLASFGFEDFVFLKTGEKDQDFSHLQPNVTGLISTKVSAVDSTAFIQSQKEYSFCFVMEDDYSTRTLEDMSYFHFLSSKSIVFDLSGRSNFLFKEVKALGVTVAEFEPVREIWAQVIAKSLKENALF